MVVSAVYLLDLKGKVLINRNYRGDISSTAVDKFMPLVLENEDDTLSPVVQGDGLSYVYVKHNNLYLLAITRKNSNVATILVYLHKIRQVFEEYFKDLQEESIRDNFVIIYELLDEMMDFGYPQITESKILQEYFFLLSSFFSTFFLKSFFFFFFFFLSFFLFFFLSFFFSILLLFFFLFLRS